MFTVQEVLELMDEVVLHKREESKRGADDIEITYHRGGADMVEELARVIRERVKTVPHIEPDGIFQKVN